ncbi:hypothetical protein [Vibrio parahaemolyticus]|uniref:hypothetical protein n=1 Tax=Vibrio parahaemolyticus TaxID=670 RepID=UPI00084B7867|nr:hypothetical protein [Vibrio parahaemolyticus]ODZ93794.1 hypothetical protein BBM50_04240 [Vibrio parahaemolyticus]OEA01718.1 hypothetical protein BBM51_13045 [Vibrio parahaemolyticus]
MVWEKSLLKANQNQQVAPFARSLLRHYKNGAKLLEGYNKVEKIAVRLARKRELFHRGKSRKGWDVFGNQSAPRLILDEVDFRKPYSTKIQLQYQELENGIN